MFCVRLVSFFGVSSQRVLFHGSCVDLKKLRVYKKPGSSA